MSPMRRRWAVFGVAAVTTLAPAAQALEVRDTSSAREFEHACGSWSYRTAAAMHYVSVCGSRQGDDSGAVEHRIVVSSHECPDSPGPGPCVASHRTSLVDAQAITTDFSAGTAELRADVDGCRVDVAIVADPKRSVDDDDPGSVTAGAGRDRVHASLTSSSSAQRSGTATGTACGLIPDGAVGHGSMSRQQRSVTAVDVYP